MLHKFHSFVGLTDFTRLNSVTSSGQMETLINV